MTQVEDMFDLTSLETVAEAVCSTVLQNEINDENLTISALCYLRLYIRKETAQLNERLSIHHV